MKLDKEEETRKFLEEQKKIGLNMAVVMFMINAMNYFNRHPAIHAYNVLVQIATIGLNGINPDHKGYKVSLIPDREFSGYQLLAYYYITCLRSRPDMLRQLQLPYDKEYSCALSLYPIFKDGAPDSLSNFFDTPNQN